jgi:hypothetical protein
MPPMEMYGEEVVACMEIGVSLLSNPLLPLSPAKRKLPSRAALTKTPFRRIFISVRRKKNVAIGPTGQNDS